MKYDRRKIMTRAWAIARKMKVVFSEALRRAWASAKAEPVNAARIAAAALSAGITEAVNTWAGWRAQGFEVIHGSKALFGAALIWASKGEGAIYNARFFGESQVQKIA